MGRYINIGTTFNNTGAKKLFFTPGASATQSWTVPAGVTCATFEIWGGGGGGSPSCCCTCWGGESGAGGGYSLKTLSVTPGSTYVIGVGQGGCGNQCWFNGNACGCQGLTTYVTGVGLSNFCAEGGKGGSWCNVGSRSACGGCAYGGDINIMGYCSLIQNACNWNGSSSGNGMKAGGASPFGGGYTWNTAAGSCGNAQIVCGTTGAYPGGGSPSRNMFNGGWCDCCAGCTAGGADGLVVITL